MRADSKASHKRPLGTTPNALSFVASAVIWLGICGGCGPSSLAPQTPAAEPEAKFVLLPGCGPYQDMILRLQGAEGLMRSAVNDPPTSRAGGPGATPTPAPIVPEWVRRRARILDQWVAETHQSSAVDTPWGTPSADLAERFADVASAARTLADVVENKDEVGVDAARTHLFETLKDLDSLASKASGKCFSIVGRVPEGHRPPPEEIQTTVRTRASTFRRCYEDGLRRNPTLTGNVAIKFHISRYGLVPWAVVDDANLPDQQVVDCILPDITRLTFSAPGRGTVTVVYPIDFSPDDGIATQVQE